MLFELIKNRKIFGGADEGFAPTGAAEIKSFCADFICSSSERICANIF